MWVSESGPPHSNKILTNGFLLPAKISVRKSHLLIVHVMPHFCQVSGIKFPSLN